jgi:hypothetical protein
MDSRPRQKFVHITFRIEELAALTVSGRVPNIVTGGGFQSTVPARLGVWLLAALEYGPSHALNLFSKEK